MQFPFAMKRLAKVHKNSLKTETYEKIMKYEPNWLEQEKRKLPHDPLVLIGTITQSRTPIDRTGYLEPYNLSYDKLPVYDKKFNKSYEEVSLNRAKQIWEMDDTVDVLFSGGVDSSSVCCAMALTKPSNKKLRIICTESTEMEFPGCFDVKLFKEHMVKISFDEFVKTKHLTPDNIILTGEPGTFNHVGGVSLNTVKDKNVHEMYNHVGENLDNIPWIKIWKYQNNFFVRNPDTLRQAEFNTKAKIDFSLLLENHFKQAPFKIETLNDMRWWLMFTFRTNWAKYATPLLTVLKASELPKKIDLNKWICFFASDEWQQWNMNGHVKKTKDSFPYKEDSKNFIKKHIGLDDFIDNKHKSTSLHHMDGAGVLLRQWNFRNFVILDNGDIVKITDLSPEIIEDITKD